MPRMTATVATLLLVAASIGVNMARYPVVWEMTRPPVRGPAAPRDGSGKAAQDLRSVQARHPAYAVPAPGGCEQFIAQVAANESRSLVRMGDQDSIAIAHAPSPSIGARKSLSQ